MPGHLASEHARRSWALRRAFLHYGLPEQVSLDHDSVFYDNASASPYPMTLHLRLIALGVGVCFIQQKPPAEHSVIERGHQTVHQQAVVGQVFTNRSALQQSLSERLDFLNLRKEASAWAVSMARDKEQNNLCRRHNAGSQKQQQT